MTTAAIVLPHVIIDHHHDLNRHRPVIIIFLVAIFYCVTNIAHAQGLVPDADEFAALKAIWENTNGSEWTNKTNWPTKNNWPFSATATQMSTWYGITVTNGDIHVINLSNNKLDGTLPDEINKLKKLRILEMSNNKLRKIPGDLTGLTSLENFSAGTNLIEGNLPIYTLALPCLGQISLPFNKFSGQIPASYGSHSRLSKLVLNDNHLTGEIPGALGSLRQLTHLMLNNNKLSGKTPIEIGQMICLQTLYLHNNKLTGSLPTSLVNLTKLVWLYVQSNNLNGSLPPLRATTIDVSNNMLTGLVPALFATQSFNGANNGFTGVDPSISSCLGLTTLNLQSNEITSLPPSLSTHPNKPNLQLQLQNNRLDYSTLESLATGFKSTTLLPQKNISDQRSQVITLGDKFTITARPTGSFTSIIWEKRKPNGTWYALANDQDRVANTFTRNTATESDEGVYRWRSGSTRFNGTTIQSEPIRISTFIDLANDNWSFKYSYDSRKRLTYKKLPGSESVFMVYDDRDRLVMTQDGEQRKSNKWLVTRYDSQNRPIITAIYTHPTYVSQSGMDSLVSKTNFSESLSASGSLWGYTNTVFPTNDLEILTVTYYDNYDFIKNNKDFEYTEGFQRVNGLVTGRRTKTLGACPYWMLSVNYYDDHGRVIHTISDNYKGGVDRVTTAYDFLGKVVSQQTVHSVNNIKWQNVAYLQIEGNKILRTPGGSTWGSSGASSTQFIPASSAGWAEATVTETNTWRYWGLSDNDIDKQPGTIDYAFYLYGSNLHIYENGVFKHAVSGGEISGDRLRISRTGSTIKYYKNNSLVYTSNVPSTSILRLDIACGSNYASFLNLNLSHSKSADVVTRWFNYDHAGRLINTWHQVNDNPKVLLSENYYNEIGQLIRKRLHSNDSIHFRQSIDYEYNIRGWMTSMNAVGSSDDDESDLFDMNLAYDKSIANLPNTPMFNGNISALKWKTVSEHNKDQSYLYQYDGMGRLTSAQHQANSANEYDLRYDLNGNIQELKRSGSEGLIDNLTYSYGTGADISNQLLRVTDAGDITKGFIDNKNTDDEYRYDTNGNMIADDNKGITVEYNQLNLPARILRPSGESVKYIYDSDGRKVSQLVLNSSGIQLKSTDYGGEFVYENDTLQFITHEEGRVVMTGAEPEYQYHLKDHLDNVRVTFTTRRNVDISLADFEKANDFETLSQPTILNSQLFDHTNTGPTYNSSRLNGTSNERFGLSKSLRVMPGDTVKAEVFAKYIAVDTTLEANLAAFTTSILSQLTLTHPAIEHTFSKTSPAESAYLLSSAYPPRSDNSAPNAYLNWLIFDNDFKLKKVGYEQITTKGREYGQDGPHDVVKTGLTIEQSGYVYLYLSNDNYAMTGKIIDVFFDDFKVEHIKSPVVQSDDYYPFGLTYNSYQRENTKTNRWKFQGQEHVDELGMNWDSFKWRNHQPDIGRFFNVDPLAEKYYYNSPYAFSENKVVAHVELEGLESVYVFDKPTRPADNGVPGTSYQGTVYVVHDDGRVAGPYAGSSYPNSKSNSDNSTSYKTIDEGTHLYNNQSGHDKGTKQGLNIVDKNGNRLAPGKKPDGASTTMTVVNLHKGFSDLGNAKSRGSGGCVTIQPNDAAAFFDNFDWSGVNGTTGTSNGTVTIYRNEGEQRTLDEIKIAILKILSELKQEEIQN